MSRNLLAAGMLATAAVLVSGCASGTGQTVDMKDPQAMMEAYVKASQPGPAHRALEPLAGRWDAVVKAWAQPGTPPAESKGSGESQWILGGRYLEDRFEGQMMDRTFQGGGVTGYDNARQEYFSIWVDDMSTAPTILRGHADQAGKVFTYRGSYDDPVTGEHKRVRAVTRIIDQDHHTFEMYDVGPWGGEIKMMEISYTRRQ